TTGSSNQSHSHPASYQSNTRSTTYEPYSQPTPYQQSIRTTASSPTAQQPTAPPWPTASSQSQRPSSTWPTSPVLLRVPSTRSDVVSGRGKALDPQQRRQKTLERIACYVKWSKLHSKDSRNAATDYP